ncbi:MAG TPA: hypothetical protein VGI66_07375 [Streptosporangiaceae bacterium]
MPTAERKVPGQQVGGTGQERDGDQADSTVLALMPVAAQPPDDDLGRQQSVPRSGVLPGLPWPGQG